MRLASACAICSTNDIAKFSAASCALHGRPRIWGDDSPLRPTAHKTRPPLLLLRPLPQKAGLDGRCLERRARRPLASQPRGRREARAGNRAHARRARNPFGLSHRHRPGLRHRRGRDRPVVPARRARRRCSRLGRVRRDLGWGCRGAEARRFAPPPARRRARSPISPRPTRIATSSSPGMGPAPACACRTRTGSPPTAKG